MEELERSCNEASTYPKNLLCPRSPALLLDAALTELRRQAPRLFCNDVGASVDFLETQSTARGLAFKSVRSRDDLRKALRIPFIRDTSDPMCRMMFFCAPSSRDKLQVTFEMAQLILSYHQVMYSFIECLFSFGFREHSQDCTLTSFQSQHQITDFERAPIMLELGRSGRSMQMCYGLRSVERTQAQPTWPWSVRQCSLYHSLDIETGRSTWIVVKANRLIERLVKDAAAASMIHSGEIPQQASVGKSLAWALRTHELVIQWSETDWQWYINFLESSLQDTTRPVLAVTMDEEATSCLPGVPDDLIYTASPTRVSSDVDDIEKKPKALDRLQTTLQACSRRLTNLTSRHGQRSAVPEAMPLTISSHKFSFKDLSHVHYIEEKANEALDVLFNNEEVIEQLKNDYSTTLPALRLALDASEVDAALSRFLKVSSDAQKKFSTQRSRVEKLLRLLRDRKTLLQGILTYESMEANRLLAEKAGISAGKMEHIAQETKLETVSMRVITLVTLFFLPGTFISTLMSTSIVTGNEDSSAFPHVSRGSLEFFVSISLPLVFFTFASWWAVYWWEHRKQSKRLAKASTTHVQEA